MAPRSIVFVTQSNTHTHTHTHPLLSGQHTEQKHCVCMWCKHVLECIRTRLKEKEENKEVVSFCWRIFLRMDINVAKNKRLPSSRGAFHWSWKERHQEKWGKERSTILCNTIERTENPNPPRANTGESYTIKGTQDASQLQIQTDRDRHWGSSLWLSV